MITVSILPQKYFVDQISGGMMKVNVLVPPGSSPHNYTVLPSQMKDLAQSKVWLQVGLLTFEEAWRSKVIDTNPDLVVVNASEGIELLQGESHEDHDEAVGGYDPHIWLAPAEVKTMAKNTLSAMQTAFPELAQEFGANFEQFVAKADSIGAWIDTTLIPLQSRNILIFHPALGYYARQYKLTQIPLEVEGKEPSPKYMKEIVDLAHSQNIRTIFIQKEFDSENALQMSREIGGEVVVIDPLEYDWEKQMREITTKIAGQK